MDAEVKRRLVEAVKVSVLAEIGKPEYWPMVDGLQNEIIRRARCAGFDQRAVDAAMDDVFKEFDLAVAEGALAASRHMIRCRAQARQRQSPFAPARLKRW